MNVPVDEVDVVEVDVVVYFMWYSNAPARVIFKETVESPKPIAVNLYKYNVMCNVVSGFNEILRDRIEL